MAFWRFCNKRNWLEGMQERERERRGACVYVCGTMIWGKSNGVMLSIGLLFSGNARFIAHNRLHCNGWHLLIEWFDNISLGNGENATWNLFTSNKEFINWSIHFGVQSISFDSNFSQYKRILVNRYQCEEFFFDKIQFFADTFWWQSCLINNQWLSK